MSSKDLTQLTIYDWAVVWIKASIGLVFAQILLALMAAAVMVPLMALVAVLGQ